MRKTKYLIAIVLSMLLMLNACIKEEALNKEADILSIIIDQEVLKREPIVGNNEVVCYVKTGTSLTTLSPSFTLSEGARIEPPNGTERDFTTAQTYTVYSEDGQWYKDYTVSFISTDISRKYHFDNCVTKNKKYQELYEVDEKGNKNMIWASGNAGFSIIAGNKPPADYPTSMAEEGYVSHSAKLVTRSTGALGSMFGSPLAAGNLFMGEFVLDISNPLKSTHFGIPVKHTPLMLKGHYKYQSGEEFKRYTDEKGKPIPEGEVLDRKDSCDIYAVFYETDENTPYLDGTNILSHPSIISLAQLNRGNEVEDWTIFEIPFTKKEGKIIDREKLKEGGYNLAIVFSSSKEGSVFNGAIGSTLFIDEVELILELDTGSTSLSMQVGPNDR